MGRLGESLERRARETLVGRDGELTRLVAFATGNGPFVLHVHGLPGIGKTQVLHALAERLRDEAPDVEVITVDAGEVEPSPAAFCAHLAPGAKEPADAARAVTAAGRRVLLVLDRYETFRLLDTWIRQVFVPALGDGVRVLLAGRAPPRPAWLVAPGWSGHLSTLELGPLPREVALAYLIRQGVQPALAAELERVAGGHPLALSMAVALVGTGAPVSTMGAASAPDALVDQLAELFLEEVPDATTRRVLQAACLVRTVTTPLVEAMLPDIPCEDALARLRALPFVRPTAHGLVVDDAVRAALDRALSATDPSLRAEHRRAAAGVVARQLRAAPRAELWRTTADVLYLLENPDLREAFFPRRASAISIEPAAERDGPAVRAIVEQHEGRDAAAAFASTWRHHRASCHVARDAAGDVAGLVQVLRPSELARGVIDKDPVLARWAQHLPGVDDRSRALWVRRLIDRDVDEQPSAAQAAAWLDIKRSYLELRPSLRWVFACMRARAVHEAAMRRLGFRLLDEHPIRFSGQAFWTLVLDMGDHSVDGWLAGLLAGEVDAGAAERAPDARLDETAHEVVVDGERVALTPLEFGVLRYLRHRPGQAVARHELLESVWEHPPDAATSNVVEAVVRSLRRKLGRHAPAVETVRGVGYRFRPTGELR
jgi:MoxR-like ATPase